MRAWVAFLFLFIFSFQVLPVRALGKMIAKAQMTEEVKGDCDDDADHGTDDTDYGGDGDTKDGKTDTEKETSISKIDDLVFMDVRNDESLLFSIIITQKKVLPPDDDLIHLFVKDIHCPPPNCR